MLQAYVPILMLLVVVAAFAGVSVGLSELLGRNRKSISKGDAYECGLEAQGSARVRLSIHFYLVAVLFILFDIESLLLLPWAATAAEFNAAGVGGTVFGQVALFLAVLVVGLAYEWRKGGLAWDR
jgi:NADH-quinone oxidoreductase subunit A